MGELNSTLQLVGHNLKQLIEEERIRLIRKTGKHYRLMDIEELVAHYCGLKKDTIKQIKRGNATCSLETALKLSYYFNCNVNDIFYLKD